VSKVLRLLIAGRDNYKSCNRGCLVRSGGKGSPHTLVPGYTLAQGTLCVTSLRWCLRGRSYGPTPCCSPRCCKKFGVSVCSGSRWEEGGVHRWQSEPKHPRAMPRPLPLPLPDETSDAGATYTLEEHPRTDRKFSGGVSLLGAVLHGAGQVRGRCLPAGRGVCGRVD